MHLYTATLLSYFAGTLLGAKTNLYNSTAYCLLLAWWSNDFCSCSPLWSRNIRTWGAELRYILEGLWSKQEANVTNWKEAEVDWQHHTSIQLCVKIPTYKCIQVCVLLVKCLSCTWKMLNMYNQCHIYLYEKLIFLIYIKKDGWKFNSSSCTWTRLEQLAPHPNYLTALRATANQLWCAVRPKIKNKQQSLPCEAYNIQKT